MAYICLTMEGSQVFRKQRPKTKHMCSIQSAERCVQVILIYLSFLEKQPLLLVNNANDNIYIRSLPAV